MGSDTINFDNMVNPTTIRFSCISMARLPRYVITNQPQHIIQRGNNRQVIFAAGGFKRYWAT